MFEKHLRKSDILSKDADLHLYLKSRSSTGVFKHFASKNQLRGFYISETLVENGLIYPKIEYCFLLLALAL